MPPALCSLTLIVVPELRKNVGSPETPPEAIQIFTVSSSCPASRVSPTSAIDEPNVPAVTPSISLGGVAASGTGTSLMNMLVIVAVAEPLFLSVSEISHPFSVIPVTFSAHPVVPGSSLTPPPSAQLQYVGK